MLRLIHQRCLTGLFHLFASCWQRMRYHLTSYKMLSSYAFSAASCYSIMYSLLQLCMVAQVLYVTRSSNLQKVQSKQLTSLLQREAMSWMRQILQGIFCNIYLKLALILNELVIQLFFDDWQDICSTLFYIFILDRTTQSLLSAVIHVKEKYLRQEALGAVSLLQFLSVKQNIFTFFTHYG